MTYPGYFYFRRGRLSSTFVCSECGEVCKTVSRVACKECGTQMTCVGDSRRFHAIKMKLREERIQLAQDLEAGRTPRRSYGE